MSLKPIINDIDAMGDKSLNLFCNSLTANALTASSIDTGSIDLTTVNCDNLVCFLEGTFTNDFTASGENTTLRGNKIPNSTTSAGNLLSNSDGHGELHWVAPPPTILSGTWTPTVSLPAGGSLSGVSDFTYTLIGDVLTFSGDFAATSVSSGNVMRFDFSLPLDKKPISNTVQITGAGGDNTLSAASRNQLGILSDVGVSVNDASISYSLSNGTSYTVGITNCVYTLTGQCRVVDI